MKQQLFTVQWKVLGRNTLIYWSLTNKFLTKKLDFEKLALRSHDVLFSVLKRAKKKYHCCYFYLLPITFLSISSVWLTPCKLGWRNTNKQTNKQINKQTNKQTRKYQTLIFWKTIFGTVTTILRLILWILMESDITLFAKPKPTWKEH